VLTLVLRECHPDKFERGEAISVRRRSKRICSTSSGRSPAIAGAQIAIVVAISQMTFEKGRLQINPGFDIDRERWLGVGRDRFPIENVRAVLDQHVDHVRVQE